MLLRNERMDVILLKKYWPLIFVVAGPYLCFLMVTDMQGRFVIFGLLLLYLVRLAALAVGGFTALSCIMKERSAREVLAVNLIVKLLQIPAYVLIFICSAANLLFVLTAHIALSMLITDLFAVAATGLIGAAGVIRAKNEGCIDGLTTIILGLLQFIFVADIVAAIVALVKTKRG